MANLERAAIELSKEWRTDKILRHLEALLIVADDKSSFLLSGNGDVIAPDDGVLANRFRWFLRARGRAAFDQTYGSCRQATLPERR